MLAAVSVLREKLQDIPRDTCTQISMTVTEGNVLLPEPEPRSEAGLLKYSGEITPGPNIANRNLYCNKATLIDQKQSYSDNADNFTHWQVVT